MRREISLRDGARAAEELASYLLGVNIVKAIDPLSPEGFLLICKQITNKLTKAAAGTEADVVAAAIAKLDLDWARLSAGATQAAMRAIDQAIATAYEKKVVPAVAQVMKVEGPKILKATKLSVITREKLPIPAKPTDEEMQRHELIRDLHVNYVRLAGGKRSEALSQHARDIVAKRVKAGSTTADIVADLKEYLGGEIPRPDSYWRVVADAFVGHGRVAEQIYAYDDAGIEKYEFVAVIDEVTTDICRFMDGRIFEVSKASKILGSLIELDDPEDVVYAHPWVRKGKDDDGGSRLYVPHADGSTTTIANIKRSGVGTSDDKGEYSGAKSDEDLVALGIPVPPLHGRCRSTIVAAFD